MLLHPLRTALAPLLLSLVLATSCQRAAYAPTAHFVPVTSQPVGKTQAEDPAIAALIAPYHDKVTAQMSEVLGTAPVPVVKTPGESPLSNFVADLQRARQRRVQAAHCFGGDDQRRPARRLSGGPRHAGLGVRADAL